MEFWQDVLVLSLCFIYFPITSLCQFVYMNTEIWKTAPGRSCFGSFGTNCLSSHPAQKYTDVVSMDRKTKTEYDKRSLTYSCISSPISTALRQYWRKVWLYPSSFCCRGKTIRFACISLNYPESSWEVLNSKTETKSNPWISSRVLTWVVAKCPIYNQAA